MLMEEDNRQMVSIGIPKNWWLLYNKDVLPDYELTDTNGELKQQQCLLYGKVIMNDLKV